MIKNILILLLSALILGFLLFFYTSTSTQTSTTTNTPPVVNEHEPNVVQWAQSNLPQTGVLKEGGKGFVYLKVDDDYIYRLFPMLHHTGYKKPEYFRRPDAPGAHISVFYEDERGRTGKIEEIGQTFSFTITGLASVPPRTHEFIVLEVKSPELEKLREKYGLSALLKGHEYHITIAKKKQRHR